MQDSGLPGRWAGCRPALPRLAILFACAVTAALAQQTRVEVETMTLSADHQVVTLSGASGGASNNVVRAKSSTSYGEATTNFAGATGVYDIDVAYFDADDGESPYRLSVDGTVLGTWTANETTSGQTMRTQTFLSVVVLNGDEIKVESMEESGEKGIIDYVEFDYVSDIPTTPPPGDPGTVWIEAEAGNEVSPLLESSDTAASGGRYIASGTEDNGTSSLDFSVDTAGTYYLWVRKIAPTAASNSFFYQIDSGSEPNASLNVGGSWAWEQFASVSLSSGAHTLHLRGREVGTKLDAFCITDDSGFTPVGEIPSTPPVEPPPGPDPDPEPDPDPPTYPPADCSGPWGSAGDLPYQERFDTWLKGRYQGAGGTNTWSSGPIAISGKQWLVLSLDYKQGGTNKLEPEDTLKVWYEINGGSPQYLVDVNGEFSPGEVMTGICVEDVSVEIKIESVTSSSSEIHFVDNIRVEAPEIGAIITVPALPSYSTPPTPATPGSSSGVVQYGTTPRFSASPHFDVEINNVEILVDELYDAAECPVLDPSATDFSLNVARLAFDFATSSTATIEVTADETINSYTISPQNPSAFGYSGTQFYTNVSTSGSTLTFDITAPRNILIKINDLPYLMVFVDPPEVSPPQPGQSNVIDLADYLSSSRDRNDDVTAEFQEALDDASAQLKTLFVPDDLYMCGQLVIGSDTHLYLSSGAMIQAIPTFDRDLWPEQSGGDSSFIFIGDNSVTMQNLTSTQVSNVIIDGRGTIDGNGWRMRYDNDSSLGTANVKLLRMANADNVLVQGVYLRHSARWSVQPILSNDVDLVDLKLINNLVGFFDANRGFHTPYVTNTDGFDIDASTNVLVDNVFVFTGDDAFTPKTTGYMDLFGECYNLTFSNNVSWSEKATLKIGSETQRDLHDIVFEDNHVIHGDRLLSVLSEGADNITIDGVDLLNNRTEFIGGNAKKRFFRFRMKHTGAIDDFTINGIDALQDDASFCSSEGLNASNAITNIVVSNFKVAGQTVDFDDVFKYLIQEDAYVDFSYSDWTFNGVDFTGGAPLP